METRRSLALTWSAAVLLSLGMGGCGVADPALMEGAPLDRVPNLLQHGAVIPDIVWMLPADDASACEGVAGELRTFLRRHGENLKLTVAYSGKRPEWIQSFLRQQRIDADLVLIDASAHRLATGGRRGMAVYLVEDDVVAAVWSPDASQPLSEAWLARVDTMLAGRRTDPS